MTDSRRHVAVEQRVASVRRHLLEQVALMDSCDEYALQPPVFYDWQQELFGNGVAAIAPRARPGGWHTASLSPQSRLAHAVAFGGVLGLARDHGHLTGYQLTVLHIATT